MEEYNAIEKLVYETKSFRLRLVREEDAQDLLAVYSDKVAVAKMNADNCTSDFYYTCEKEMKECIQYWLDDGHRKKAYLRFAIIAKSDDKAIGTAEIVTADSGVLRLDLRSDYLSNLYIEELIRLAVLQWIGDFCVKKLKIKTDNTPERIEIMEKYGFVPIKKIGKKVSYYERNAVHFFDSKKGMAFCALACCVCSENKNCLGCRNEGCKGKEWCKCFRCCSQKKIASCRECENYPCEAEMINRLRNKVFFKFSQTYGVDALLCALRTNEERGVLYHYHKKLIGDYDQFESEEKMTAFLLRGLQFAKEDD